MFRTVCGGGKGDSGSSYDPQIGKAADQAAATAAKAEQFSETYYNDIITPLLKQQNEASLESQGKLNRLYDINADQTQLASDRYKQYGIPAEQRYYDMVDKYSEPEEMERQATNAKGDFAVAQANQQGALDRHMSAMGIDPTSPAAIAAKNDAAIQGAALEASAMNRARSSARQLGMQLTSDAANFGRGGQSGILAFGAGAQGNASGAFGIANQALATGSQAGNSVNQGYATALSGYNGIMDSYAKLGSAEIQANAQKQDPLASLAGSAMGMFAGSIKFSDVRLKENLVPVGLLTNGVVIYTFNYIDSPRLEMGVLAQDLLKVQPDAVHVSEDGFYMVDYSKLEVAGE